MKLAKGYFGSRSKVFTVAKNAVDRALNFAFRDRRAKKRAFRTLWIARINAGVRPLGLSYSRFIHLMDKNDVGLNRKVLADLAMNHPETFKAVVDKVK
jgi:large subunit ribosomal protein L20